MKIILATHNDHKTEEIRKIFKDTNISFLSLKDLNDSNEVVEDGKTFKENAYIKAKYIFDKYHLPTLADDSGLEVKALNNEPGIYSSRYAGGDYVSAMNNIIKRLDDKDDRTADFNCSICFIDENGKEHYFEEKVYGKIAYKITGKLGFGYDPIFMYNGICFADMEMEEKNKVSHRGKAFKKFYEFITRK